MFRLIVTPRAGEPAAIDTRTGVSVMEIIRDAGFDTLAALCGGCCSCATCHVYVDPAYAGRMTPISEEEDMLLDGTGCREATSRLSCQIAFVEALDGMAVRIAPGD